MNRTWEAMSLERNPHQPAKTISTVRTGDNIAATADPQLAAAMVRAVLGG